MEPPVTTPSDSHVVQSSAAVQKAYSAASQKDVSLPPSTTPAPALSSIPVQLKDESTIEQQWIEKVKQVVVRTQDDPFMQNKLLSELKAEYLETRYGRPTGAKQDK